MEGLKRTSRVVAWVLLGLHGVWFVGHYTLGDDGFFLVAWHLGAAFVGFGLIPAVLIAAAGRDRIAVATATALFAWWAGVNLWGAVPGAPEGEPCMTLVYSNVLMVNDRPEALKEELVGYDADLLYLAEYSHQFEPGFSTDAVADRWPHQHRDPQTHSFGHGVFSDRPFTVQEHDIGGVDALEVRTTCDGRDLTLILVHVLPPYNAGLARRWHAHLDAVGALAERIDGPLALIGDLNATRHLPSLHHLLDRRNLRSAHMDLGLANTPSWPNGKLGFASSFLRLDHLLLSEELAVQHLEDGAGTGADHKPIIATIGFR